MGAGGMDAGKILASLDLPNAAGAKNTFNVIENVVGPIQRSVCKDAMEHALIEEVRMTLKEEPEQGVTFEEWMKARRDGTDLPIKPKIVVSIDMGWQCRRRTMDSLSAHAFLIGARTGLPIGARIYAKQCQFCETHEREENEEIPNHECPKNFNGTSKSMESMAAHELYTSLYTEEQVHAQWIIADDDSSMRSQLQWKIQDKLDNKLITEWPKYVSVNGKNTRVKCKGKLDINIPEPTFLADPNHRKRVLVDHMYKQKKEGKKKTSITDCDILREGQNFAYMRNGLLKKLDRKHEWEQDAKAVVEHHFDNHEFCGDFCKRKKETAEERELTRKRYRDKQVDPVLHEQLTAILAKFISLSRLEEIVHPYNTQRNESLNSFIAWFAPKHRTYSRSMSLENRISIAVGITIFGYFGFWTRVYDQLCIPMPLSTKRWLEKRQEKRERDTRKSRTVESKKRRRKKWYEKLANKQKEMENSKHDGDYGRGTGFIVSDLGATVSSGSKTTASTDAHVNKKRRTGDKNPLPPLSQGQCRFCGKMGHTTTRSRACDKNPINTTIVQLDAALACPEVVVTMGGTQQQSDSSFASNGNVPSPPSVPPQSSGSVDTELSSGDTVLELPIDGTYTSGEKQKETIAEKGVSDTLEAVVADELEAGCSVTHHRQVIHLASSNNNAGESTACSGSHSEAGESSSVSILHKDPVLNLQECRRGKNIDDDICDSVELDLLDQIFLEDDAEDDEVEELLEESKYLDDPAGSDDMHND